MKKISINIKGALFAMFLLTTGCNKYLEDTQLPSGIIDGVSVYQSDVTTSTVVTGLYLNLSNSGPFNASAGSNMGYTLGLYTDELRSILSGNFADTFYKNAIQSGQSLNWSDLYNKLFVVNTALEGINASTGTLLYKNQWLGECYFMRAYYYYLLTNYYGDVPLALTSDYKTNNLLSRAPKADVYKQIIADLKLAQTLLPADYKNGYAVTTTNRLRPNQAVASALLARMYLYTGDWASAEAQASTLINNTATYQLVPLAQVFLAASKETIWCLAAGQPKPVPEFAFYNNGMPAVITPPNTPASSSVFACLSANLLNAFEANDGRFINWTRSSTVTAAGANPATTFYFPAKYKSSANNAEYQVLFRLAEMYLIRAEARVRQNKDGAAADLNAVRTRAGLGNTSATTQADLLTAIAKERQVELFTECGHRFFDLKRTGTIDAVMTAVAPSKGGTWSPYMALFPIPPADLVQNPNLTANPGYLR